MRFNFKKQACGVKFFTLCFTLLLSFFMPTISWAINSSEVAAQQTKFKPITIQKNQALVSEILTEIKRQTGVNIIANSVIVKELGRKTLNVKNASLSEVLATLLANTPYEYKIIDNNVTISLKDSPAKQQKTQFSGKVLDSNKKPLPGASVTIKGTTIGVTTGIQGEFTIPAKTGDQVLFAFVGMIPQEMTYTSQKDLTVVMQEATQKVDEVVVTGIFKKAAETFTGAAVQISGKELHQFGSRNVLQTLRNIDPAFNILENNSYGSDPNKLPDVQIRGASSIPNVDDIQDDTRTGLNTPLVILDGFESSLQTLLDMNQDELESITLLKDASATAIYGSRGANGVIVLETKVPVKGKLKISYRGYVNVDIPDISSYNMMNAREKLDFEQQVGVYGDKGSYALQQQYNHLLAQVNRGVNTDWLSQPLRIGVGQRHNVKIEGGDDIFRYSASVQYNNTVGVMKQSEKNNFNGNVNLSYKHKNIRFTNNTIIGLNNTGNSPYGKFSDYVNMNPYFAPYKDGKMVKTFGLDGEGAIKRWGLDGVANPLWNSTLNTYDKSNLTQITNNFAIDWDLTEDLTVRGKVGLIRGIGGVDQFYPADHTMFMKYSSEDMLRKGKYVNGNSKSNSIDATLNINYSHTFAEKHLLYAGLNFNARQYTSTSTSITAEGFSAENLDFLSMALQYEQGGKPSGSESKSRALGMVANANYSYDNRYFADLTLTTDGNSAFGTNNRFATFWSSGIGWNIHNESFLKDNPIVNKLKLRGSVGTSGNQSFSAYQALTTYQYSTSDRYFNWVGADVKSLGNPSLKWQRKMNYNIGLESEFLNRRLQFVVDAYLETTKDQISSINVPSSTGFTSYIDNIGEVQNKGVELKLTGYIIRNSEKQLYWSVTGSTIHNVNKISKLSAALKEAQTKRESDGSSSPLTLYKEGHSMDDIWVVPSLGIDPSTGKELFIDKQGNPTWTWNSDNLTACGISKPKFQGNINTNLRWRNFQLTASFGYRLGGQVYNQTLIDKVENVNYTYNLDARVKDFRWQKTGDQSLFKSIYVTSTTQKTSRFVQNERTFNCQNATLTYDFNRDLIKPLKLQALSMQISFNDIFYLSSVKRERGLIYPFSRQFSFSLNATF